MAPPDETVANQLFICVDLNQVHLFNHFIHLPNQVIVTLYIEIPCLQGFRNLSLLGGLSLGENLDFQKQRFMHVLAVHCLAIQLIDLSRKLNVLLDCLF